MGMKLSHPKRTNVEGEQEKELEEVTRDRRKLHCEELHNVSSSPNIISMIK
jgi:hypothetical protein